jgi:hypothetical protein
MHYQILKSKDEGMNTSKPFSKGVDPSSNRQGDPWPTHFVRLEQLAAHLPDELQRIVDVAQDERPIQKWCEEKPVSLLPFLSGVDRGWVFGRPKLGAEFIPDLMLCHLDSSGYHWHLIELENPRYSALTNSAGQNAKLTHAVQQVLDWRIWLRENVQYARSELGFQDLDGEFEGYVIIGRRREMSRREKNRYRELSRDKLTVMTYDRFVERVASAVKLLRFDSS